MIETFQHYTVMSEEAVGGLNIKSGGVYVDYILSGAGHSKYLLGQLSSKGHLHVSDQDQKAIDHAKLRLASYVKQGMVIFIETNFRELEERLSEYVDKIDGILYGLGVSSPQLNEAERGLSYHQDVPLGMHMDRSVPLTAHCVINEYSYHELVKIFFRYGEEEFSKQIAHEIERVRKTRSIQTTGELVEIIKQVIPAPVRGKGGRPAKGIFQTVRIVVNDKLGAEETSLKQVIRLLRVNEEINVITFHSLEDRIVKSVFKEYSTVQDLPPGLPVILDKFQPELRVITCKPILPSEKELAENNRSCSAELHIAEKIKMKEE